MRDRQSGRPSTANLKRLDIAIIGRACRLPGASSAKQLWDVLQAGRCTVSKIPPDRWPQERLLHPRPKERGRSYTWAAGVLDDIWGFDPSVYGISPREAEQMDPQQRLLLDLTWEALEDAGIRPSGLAGSETGVFVGGSTLDYGNLRLHDPAGADAYFATGNTLAVLSNRISYAFDLHGPSFTVDTACSSSLVALDAAVAAIEAGRIDTAIVGGVNILASPFGFISFSQATMLSKAGLCQAFSAKADGYVRAEGGVVLVLRAAGAARSSGDRVHAIIAGSQTNSDGRTSGISLPSKAYQAALLEQVYLKHGVDPNALAFIEAHGTGTRVGDPVEAAAIGEVLGQRRGPPLPIGSIKTNIGHTEAASGLAGMFKAMLALEHNELPRSLHFDEPNPDISFSDLNVSVCSAPLALARNGHARYAGISSLGFGGTNAHVILADPPTAPKLNGSANAPHFLLLSAQSREGLAELARQYSARLTGATEGEVQRIASATGHRREAHAERLVIPFDDPGSLIEALDEAGRNEGVALAASTGTAVERASPVAFIFSGNGGQWPGMGQSIYESSPVFRDQFNKIDRIFRGFAGWSLAETMLSSSIASRLEKTSVAQPLIFAIQLATVRCLARLGIAPDMVLGHSMGEIAAAEAAGVFDLETAVRVIYFRSRHQEIGRDAGGMAVVFGPLAAVETLAGKVPGLTIAAHNSPRSFTVSGPFSALDQAAKVGRAHKLRMRRLELSYPFHSDLMKPVEVPLLADLESIQPKPGEVKFVSSVDGCVLSGPSLGARYWWRNVREPVRFVEGVQLAMRLGARVFIEIGPSPVLISDIRKIAEESASPIAALAVLDQKPARRDPFRAAAAQALSLGARIDPKIAFGDDPGPVADLPAYPWRRKPYRLTETTESTGWTRVRPSHPLIGARLSPDSLEWRAQLDPVLAPALADHRIEGQVLLPGAAFAEMALAAARDWLGTETAAIRDLEIVQPMLFAANISREILCRISPGTGTVEIMSRARLSDSPWVGHAKAKIILKPAPVAACPAAPAPGGRVIEGSELYAIACQSGLEFGPAFRQVLAASHIDGATITVDLTAAEENPVYGLDPARLDACFHGLILLFADELGSARPAAYLPVRFAEIKLEKPGATIARARIDVRRHDTRAIIADFALYDGGGSLIARLQGARYQAVRREMADLSSRSVVQTTILADEPTAVRRDPPLSLDALAKAALSETLAPEGDLPPDVVLVEGWATAAAYQLARALAVEGRIDGEELIASGRFPPAGREWLRNLLVALEKSGLAQTGAQQIVLAGNVELPNPSDILQSLAAEYPRRSAELLLAARAGAIMGALARGEETAPLSESAIESFETGSAAAAASAELLASLLRRLGPSWPRSRALRILQIGHGPLSWHAAELVESYGARLTIHDPNPRRLERARLAFARESRIRYADSLEQLPDGGFDLVIAAEALHRLAPGKAQIARIVSAMAPEALIAAVEPERSLFRDLVFAPPLSAPMAGSPEGESFSAAPDWTERFAATPLRGLSDRLVKTAAGPARLIMGERPAFAISRSLPAKVLIVGQDEPEQAEAAEALARTLENAGVNCTIARERAFKLLALSDSDEIVLLAPAMAAGEKPAKHLAQRCLTLKNWSAELGKNKHRLWIECPGALRAISGWAGPVETGLWAFARSLANEYSNLDVRRLDTCPEIAAPVRAQRIADAVLSGTDETELILDAESTRAVRLQTRTSASLHGQAARASRLEKGEGAGLDRIRWVPARRQSPGPSQVEIAVAAAGLNFRDVMWGLSVLPDEMLEEGLAGPTLGLECAGYVVSTGENAGDLKPGDAVAAIAGGAFATHVTVDSRMVVKLPEGLPLEAAVTIPVAFLTAYYALISCARVQPGEWVLVHGGAGGVGLAALQIARWRGARVIATASSAEKRDLVSALGAEHVFDARAHAFVDDVRRVTGNGVAVALNSLSGEAMELTMGLLQPFGRFIELGKRDFLANTHIGLRPFRNNLTYFGVDLDQLMLVQPETSRQLFTEVLDLVAQGEFAPLPYRSFRASEFVEAMRLMQQSGHIGKIVITPPAAGEIPAAPQGEFKPAPGKTHLITGGCGGFGLAAALWLARRGARHLILAGRSGASSPGAQEALASLSAMGVTVHVEAIDVADAEALENLINRTGREFPPLAGVFHAAMVLDDALIANLDAERLKKVLAPKVTGALNLDRLTRGLPLDYFVLFSSATTAIGNPGQGNYVAANGFLEGLARQRRTAGLPALAVAWGGIEDVGLLARNRLVKDMLATRAGVKTMAARDALDLMAEALARQGMDPDEAVIVISEMNWSTASAHLPLLQSPAYGALLRNKEAAAAETRAKLDIRALATAVSPEEVRRQIIDAIVEEIAQILRLPRESVNRGKPLADIGVDSLMAVELAAALEERLTLDVPLTASASGFNAGELADHILGLCTSPTGEDDSIAQGLAERHLGKGIDPTALESLTVLVEERSRDLTQILR
ncbi:MAG: SDR family NAD(P)-dependent oxidoreductase [Beijerinckiaceae bacterium]|nr:SDR family NAD(P)-dependent oxidoreductase [Beijerinckiaceae bacterium]